MKRVLAIVLAVLLPIVVAGVVAVTFLVDWNVFKGEIAQRAMQATGRAVAIDGDIDLAFFPAPSLTAAGVRVASIEGASEPDMLRLKELRIRLSLPALFEGRIGVDQLVLIKPVIVLERLRDGRANWVLTPTGDPEGEMAASAGDAADIAGGRAAGSDVAVDSLSIRDGTLIYRDGEAGTAEQVEKLTADIELPSLSGPFSVEAVAEARGMPVELRLRTGTIRDGGPLPVTLSLAWPQARATAAVSGRVTSLDAAGELTGKLKLESADAARAAAAFGAAMPSALALPVSVEGELTVSRREAALNDMTVRLGDVSATGALNASFGGRPRADLLLKVGRVDLDQLLSVAGGQSGAVQGPASFDTGAKGATGGAAPTAGPATVADFTLPDGIDATVDVAVEVVRYRGDMVREVGLRATLGAGTVTLDGASALLPGGSEVSLVGFLQAAGGTPMFEGEAAASSDNLRALLRWLDLDVDAVPAERLRGFSYSSRIKATPSALEANDINLRVDATTMTGGLAVALRERLGFGLRLSVDRLNLDGYLSPSESTPPAGGVTGQATGGSEAVSGDGKTDVGGLSVLEAFDANVDLRVDRLTWQNTVAQKAHLDALLVGGDLTLRNLSVDRFAGVAASAKGSALNIVREPGFAIEFQAKVEDADAAVRFADMVPPFSVGKLRGATLTGRIEGGRKAVSIEGTVLALDGKLSANGVVTDPLDAPAVDLAVAFDHPKTTAFLGAVAPGYRPAVEDMGPLAVALRMVGTPAAVKIGDLRAGTSVGEVRGTVAVALKEPRPVIDADLTTSEIILDLLLPASGGGGSDSTAAERSWRPPGADAPGGAAASGRWSAVPVDLGGLKAFDGTLVLEMAGLVTGQTRFANPSVTASLDNGRLDVSRFAAGAFGGTVTGKGVVDARAEAVAVTAALAAHDIQAGQLVREVSGEERVEGPVSATADLRAAGRSEAELVAALTGTANVAGQIRLLATEKEQAAAGALGLAGVLFGDKVRELRQAGDLSGVLFSAFGRSAARLSGDIRVERGIAQTDNLLLDGSGARAATVGTVDLPAWTIRSETSVYRADAAQEPVVTASLSGPLDAPNVRLGGSFLREAAPQSGADALRKILPKVLGRDGPAEALPEGTPPPPSSGQPVAPKPEDVIRDLLKGVLQR